MIDAGLSRYRSEVADPSDFDSFWDATLQDAQRRAGPVGLTEISTPLRSVRAFDLEFSGAQGDRIAGWLLLPSDAERPPPVVVEYLGYGDGRGSPMRHLLPVACGFAHVVMDNRGQGAGRGQSPGVTDDPHPTSVSFPGMLTRGIRDRDTYYYRRLFCDGARLIDVVRDLEPVDGSRIAVLGTSQGAATAVAAAALRADVVRAAALHTPLMTDVLASVATANDGPYREIAAYLSTQRDAVDEVANTLAYFDGVNFARRATAPVRISFGMLDALCPPRSAVALHHVYRGEKHLQSWPFNGHEGGALEDRVAALEHFARELPLRG